MVYLTYTMRTNMQTTVRLSFPMLVLDEVGIRDQLWEEIGHCVRKVAQSHLSTATITPKNDL